MAKLIIEESKPFDEEKHKVLLNHGYVYNGKGFSFGLGNRDEYLHPKTGQAHVYEDKSWEHLDDEGRTNDRGHETSHLNNHLKDYHK